MSTNQEADGLQMPKPQKRDNEYYEQQLKDRFPAIHADYLAGKFRSLRQALLTAGIRTERTRLLELKNAWTNATGAEKRAFLRWLGKPSTNAQPASRPGKAIGAARPVAKRKLTSRIAKKIQAVMKRRSLTWADLSDELGLSRNDMSVASAIRQGNQLNSEVVEKIEKWLVAN